MTKTWARLDAKVDATTHPVATVAEVVELPDAWVPGVNIFHPDLVYVDATGVTGVAISWTYNGSTFSAPAPPPSPTVSDLLKYAGSKQNAVLAGIWTFNVGTTSAPINLTTKLDASGQAAMLDLLLWSKLIATAGQTQSYNMADGTPGPSITADQAASIAMQAGQVKTASFATLNAVAAEITASPPTITTNDEIDGAAWPSSTP